MADLRVAVCTNRDLPVLRECLAALTAQGADVVVVASGPEAPASLEGVVAAAGAALVREQREGLSRARNRALADCADEDVVAFVDDDVVVSPGWLAAVDAAWETAGDEVACVGGPIRLRFAAEEPAWLSGPLLPVLCHLDYGSSEQDIDPTVRTVYGGNVSFRCGPLRAVGGFDPGFGHRGPRAWFSEEDEAQRALARAGWRIRYAPAAWVEHVIPPERLRPAWFAARRFRYGATLGLRGARSRRLAARQALSSGIGAAVATARGDRRLAVERAVRAAENAGVLLARRVAR